MNEVARFHERYIDAIVTLNFNEKRIIRHRLAKTFAQTSFIGCQLPAVSKNQFRNLMVFPSLFMPAYATLSNFLRHFNSIFKSPIISKLMQI